jgi:hypothetical protein
MNAPTAILARSGFATLRELQRVLRRGGVSAEIVRPPDSDPNR